MSNYSIVITKEKKNKQTIQNVLLEGDLNIFNAEQIKNELQALCNNKFAKNIFVKKITAIDACFLQIVIALLKSLKTKGVAFNISWELDIDKRNLLTNCGYEFLIKN